jgi:hypothetical protein
LCTAAAAAAGLSNLRLKRVTCCWQQLWESGLQTLEFYLFIYLFIKMQFVPNFFIWHKCEGFLAIK